MTDLERIVRDLITAEVNELPLEDIITKVRLNEIEAQKTGAVMTGMGCKFCLAQYDELQGEERSTFECDLKECLIYALVYPVLGVLQSVELGVDIANATVALTRLASTLQTVFSERKSRELAQRLMKQLDASYEGPVQASITGAPSIQFRFAQALLAVCSPSSFYHKKIV